MVGTSVGRVKGTQDEGSSKTELDDELLLVDPVRSNEDPAEVRKEHWSRLRILILAIIFCFIVIVLAAGWGAMARKNRGTSSARSGVGRAGPRPPTWAPSVEPALKPSAFPTFAPTGHPSSSPSRAPTAMPSDYPSANPSTFPTSSDQVTTFYAIGDVPYTPAQAVKLKSQMLELPGDAEFLIHVGDIRAEDNHQVCVKQEYESVASILRLSHAPVFIVLGDNDWNDCPDQDAGLAFWKADFLNFQSRYWNHTFKVINQPGRPENFAFEHKGTLFVGLNLVGGAVRSTLEWSTRLTDEVNWTMDLIRQFAVSTSPKVGRVILFGQAFPTDDHRPFFEPLTRFIADELHNGIPILYIHGDGHYWLYEPSFYGQPSFLRIMVSGKAVDPALQVVVHANGGVDSTQDAFDYNRRLL